MRRIGFERWGRWGIGALLLLLTHGPFMSRTAQAGCDHGASTHSHRWSIHHDLEVVLTGDLSAWPPSDPGRDLRSGEVPDPPSPCSGPGCSNHEPDPLSTIIAGVDHSDRWGDLNAPADFPILSPWSTTIEEPAERTTGLKPSIFHPPPRRALDRAPGLGPIGR